MLNIVHIMIIVAFISAFLPDWFVIQSNWPLNPYLYKCITLNHTDMLNQSLGLWKINLKAFHRELGLNWPLYEYDSFSYFTKNTFNNDTKEYIITQLWFVGLLSQTKDEFGIYSSFYQMKIPETYQSCKYKYYNYDEYAFHPYPMRITTPKIPFMRKHVKRLFYIYEEVPSYIPIIFNVNKTNVGIQTNVKETDIFKDDGTLDNITYISCLYLNTSKEDEMISYMLNRTQIDLNLTTFIEDQFKLFSSGKVLRKVYIDNQYAFLHHNDMKDIQGKDIPVITEFIDRFKFMVNPVY